MLPFLFSINDLVLKQIDIKKAGEVLPLFLEFAYGSQ